MFGIRNGRGDVPSSPAPAEGRAPVGTAEPAPAAAEAEAAANLAGAGAGAEAAAAAAAAAATDQAPYSKDRPPIANHHQSPASSAQRSVLPRSTSVRAPTFRLIR
ncbi:unnamed protein product [Closterium sp. NIES-53]